MIVATGSLLIVAGLLVLSGLVGLRVFAHVSLGRLTRNLVLAAGLMLFVTGIVIHVKDPFAVVPVSAQQTPPAKAPAGEAGFTFIPKKAKWGEEVEIRVKNPGKSMDVYFNGVPLPAKISGNNDTLVVTIPSITRSGFFMVKVDGVKLESSEQLIVVP